MTTKTEVKEKAKVTVTMVTAVVRAGCKWARTYGWGVCGQEMGEGGVWERREGALGAAGKPGRLIGV